MMARTIVVNAEAEHDVLARVIMLFHRRAIVILSFSMAPAELPGVLGMEITIDTDREQLNRIVADLYKLVNVLSVKLIDAPVMVRP